jgi:hypothetical protein
VKWKTKFRKIDSIDLCVFGTDYEGDISFLNIIFCSTFNCEVKVRKKIKNNGPKYYGSLVVLTSSLTVWLLVVRVQSTTAIPIQPFPT